MIDFEHIQKTLVNKLQDELQVPVIVANPDGPKPQEPFVILNFTSPYIPSGSYVEETKDEEDCYVEIKRTSWDKMVASLTFYGDDNKNGLKALDYIQFKGYDELRKEAGLVLVSNTALQNRDVYVIDQWERKTGFDATFRVVSETLKQIDSIQSVNKEED